MLQLIMTWNEGFYGNLGDISDTSELGYAELAYEYQELAMEPFCMETNGVLSENIEILSIINEEDYECLLDDKKTVVVIDRYTAEQLDDWDREIYDQYCYEIQKENPNLLDIEFDMEKFKKMLQEAPILIKPWQMVGYFEDESTIEDSKKNLNNLILQIRQTKID